METWKEPGGTLELRIRLAKAMGWKPYYNRSAGTWRGVSKDKNPDLLQRDAQPFAPDLDRNDLALVLSHMRGKKRSLIGMWWAEVQIYYEHHELDDAWHDEHGSLAFFLVAGPCEILATLALKVLEEGI